MDIVELLFDLLLVSIAGLFIAFSPILIVTNLLIVLRSKRPIFHAVVLLASIVLPLLLLCGIATFALESEADIGLKELSSNLSLPPLANVFIGIVLLVFALRKFKQLKYAPLEPKKVAKPSKQLPTGAVPLFIFGFMKTLLSLTNIFAILFVTKLVTVNDLAPLLALLVLFWTIAVGMIPFLIIIYYRKNRRADLLRFQNKVDTILQENIKLYLLIGLGGLGVAMAAVGLIHIF
jgi:hypothetical protein